MTQLDFESDAFLRLLCEAIRAGPGSPQWHEAVQRLRAGGIAHADEYRLLITAREHLESGREYRSVRAGPGFARKLMAAIDQGAQASPSRPVTSTSIAIASGGVMLVALLIIGFFLFKAAERPPSTSGTTLLTDAVASLGGSAALPADWRQVGGLEIELARNSIKAAPTSNPSTSGGALMWRRAIDPSEPFSIVAVLRGQRVADDVIPQVFVTDEPDFSQENATTSHELVWLLRARQAQLMLPGGHIQSQSELPADPKENLVVRITVDRTDAVVDVGGNVFWSGPHSLQPNSPRYVGIRLLRRSPGAGDAAVFQAVRINMRQK